MFMASEIHECYRRARLRRRTVGDGMTPGRQAACTLGRPGAPVQTVSWNDGVSFLSDQIWILGLGDDSGILLFTAG